ncbi:MAG: hypothetical protein ABI855_13910 [Bacteroidota bacterium]
MNSDIRLKFDQMRQNNSSPEDGEINEHENSENEFYPAHGNNRNLCFMWPDGKSMFLNYAYLVSGEFEAEENIITLIYTTHIVTLKGIDLNFLFQELFANTVKRISVSEHRYNEIKKNTESIVNEINIQKTFNKVMQ